MNTSDDEQAIRDLVDTWMKATKAGDIQAVLDLMADDVVFMVPGQEPFGKEAFKKALNGMADIEYEGKSDIVEINVLGDFAYIRTYLEVIATSPDSQAPTKRAGYTLTILRKEPDGKWRLARDANLLTSKE